MLLLHDGIHDDISLGNGGHRRQLYCGLIHPAPSARPKGKSSNLFIYAALLANVVLFFYKPLFSTAYMFPWDFRSVQLPMLTYLADELRSHRFALWSPFTYCGYPIFANIEACFFHPLTLSAAFLNGFLTVDRLPLLLEWVVVLQIWFAGVVAYHLFREWGMGRAGALVGAIIFETGGYFPSRAEHIGSIMAVAWMPLAWLSVWKLREPSRLRWLAILSASLGMSVLGGFPQPTLAVFVSTVVLSLLLVILRMSKLQTVGYTLCGCALGIALSAVQFIPTTQLTNHSVAKYRTGWLGTGGGLHWQSLVSLVAPNYYSLFDMQRFKGPDDPTFLYLYCSIAGLALGLYALIRVRSRYVGLLAATGFFGMLWMLGDKTFVWNLLFPLLPDKIKIGIHPEYTYCIFILALAGLAGTGLDHLRIPALFRWGVAGIIAVDLFLVGSGRPMNLVRLQDEPGVTRDSFEGSPELIREVRRYTNQSFPPWRIDTSEASMNWAFYAPVIRVPTATGIAPLAPEDVIQLRLSLHDGFPWGWWYPVEKFDSPILDLMNVRYLVVGAKAAARLRTIPKFRFVQSLPGNDLFENLNVMPRFFLVHRAIAAGSREEAIKLIESRSIDFKTTAITYQPLSLTAAGATYSENIKPLAYEPNSLELSVTSSGTSLLVMSETWYPGWEAWLDGKPARILQSNLAFRGVVIPDGTHTVRMEFRPTILWVSLGVSALTVLVLVSLAVIGTYSSPTISRYQSPSRTNQV